MLYDRMRDKKLLRASAVDSRLQIPGSALRNGPGGPETVVHHHIHHQMDGVKVYEKDGKLFVSVGAVDPEALVRTMLAGTPSGLTTPRVAEHGWLRAARVHDAFQACSSASSAFDCWYSRRRQGGCCWCSSLCAIVRDLYASC